MNAASVGESQITPQMQQQITPDVVSPQGKQQLMQHLGAATQEKPMLDTILKNLASKIGADFSSRVKNPQTVVQKIAQKRLQGRDYNVQDVNDAYGARIVINNAKQLAQAKEGLQHLAKAGAINILKSQDVTSDTYHAYHFDIQTPKGTRGEVQLMTPKEELESLANHSLRSVYGEDQPDHVQTLRDTQASLAKNISNAKAKQLSEPIKHLSSQTNGQPIDPRIIASIMQHAL